MLLLAGKALLVPLAGGIDGDNTLPRHNDLPVGEALNALALSLELAHGACHVVFTEDDPITPDGCAVAKNEVHILEAPSSLPKAREGVRAIPVLRHGLLQNCCVSI
jgi:hypothetical protein